MKEHLNVDEKIELIKEFKESGVSAIEFAQTRNVSVVSLRNWIKIFEKGGREGLKTKYER